MRKSVNEKTEMPIPGDLNKVKSYKFQDEKQGYFNSAARIFYLHKPHEPSLALPV